MRLVRKITFERQPRPPRYDQPCWATMRSKSPQKSSSALPSSGSSPLWRGTLQTAVDGLKAGVIVRRLVVEGRAAPQRPSMIAVDRAGSACSPMCRSAASCADGPICRCRSCPGITSPLKSRRLPRRRRDQGCCGSSPRWRGTYHVAALGVAPGSRAANVLPTIKSTHGANANYAAGRVVHGTYVCRKRLTVRRRAVYPEGWWSQAGPLPDGFRQSGRIGRGPLTI